jgi:hypothetical protein
MIMSLQALAFIGTICMYQPMAPVVSLDQSHHSDFSTELRALLELEAAYSESRSILCLLQKCFYSKYALIRKGAITFVDRHEIHTEQLDSQLRNLLMDFDKDVVRCAAQSLLKRGLIVDVVISNFEQQQRCRTFAVWVREVYLSAKAQHHTIREVAIQRIFNDKCAAVRETAIEILELLDLSQCPFSRNAISQVALSDEADSVRRRAIWALATLGEAEISTVLECLHRIPRDELWCALALVRCGPGAKPHIAALTDSRNLDVRNMLLNMVPIIDSFNGMRTRWTTADGVAVLATCGERQLGVGAEFEAKILIINISSQPLQVYDYERFPNIGVRIAVTPISPARASLLTIGRRIDYHPSVLNSYRALFPGWCLSVSARFKVIPSADLVKLRPEDPPLDTAIYTDRYATGVEPGRYDIVYSFFDNRSNSFDTGQRNDADEPERRHRYWCGSDIEILKTTVTIVGSE